MGYKDYIRFTFCHETAENFMHLFWSCSQIELFWKQLIASDRNFLSNEHFVINLVVSGLKLDPSKNKATINFVVSGIFLRVSVSRLISQPR